MFRRMWKKIVAIAGIIVAVWLATPVPEVSIIVGLLGRGTLSSWFPRWLSWPGAAAGVIVGWYFDLPERVYRTLKEK